MYKLMHKLKLEVPAHKTTTSHTRTTVEQLKINKPITLGAANGHKRKCSLLEIQPLPSTFP